MIEKVVLRLLSLKSYSTYELRKKLIRKGFVPQEIETVLEKFQKLGFLNDQDLAERRGAAYKRRGYGPHRIAGKFKQQGLKPSSYSPEEQKEIILRLLETPAFLRKDRNKKIAALQRRGFDLEILFDIIKFDL